VAALVDPGESRRLSRVCQFTIAAARLALRESGLDPAAGLGLVVGTEFGDLASTHAFADGFSRAARRAVCAPVSQTVMNTMVATTAIAVGARELALTLNAPTVAGELAVARATAAVASGRVPAVLAGGVDELDPVVERELERFGFDAERRSEGAAFLVLEPRMSAEARGAPVLGEISAAAWRALPARPWGVGRSRRSPAIEAVLEAAGACAADLGWVYASGSCDDARDRWEEQVLGAALGSVAPVSTLGRLLGRHAGSACCAWRPARGPHARTVAGHGRRDARGACAPGTRPRARAGARRYHVALVVDAA